MKIRFITVTILLLCAVSLSMHAKKHKKNKHKKSPVQKVALPVAHIGAAVVAQKSPRAGIQRGLDELAAWAEGRTLPSASEQRLKEKKENLQLLEDVLGKEGLKEYLLGGQKPYCYVPYQPPPPQPIYYQPVQPMAQPPYPHYPAPYYYQPQPAAQPIYVHPAYSQIP